jgi:5-methyltetrahydrofolate--homocysteine methyltransferase
MGIHLQFSAKDWDRIRHDWTAWWHQEIDRPMVIVNALEFDGGEKFCVQGFGDWDMEQRTYPIEPVLDYHQRILEAEYFYGDSWPRWWPNYGPGIMAGFIGAHVQNDANTVWFEMSDSPALADIHPEYQAENFWWQWVKEITQAAVQRWEHEVTVACTDLGGNLDILASLRGSQNLLTDLCDVPDEVDRLVDEITHLWLRYYDELFEIIHVAENGTTSWAPLWCPGRYYMLQSDFAYMISPAMFERFVMPDLETICNHLEYGFYHLDGKGQIPHLDMLLSIENLRGVQWIPGDGQPPAHEWLPLLKRIRDGGKLCQIYATPQGALDVVRELGGKGFAFWVTGNYPKEEIKAFLTELEVIQ